MGLNQIMDQTIHLILGSDEAVSELYMLIIFSNRYMKSNFFGDLLLCQDVMK